MQCTLLWYFFTYFPISFRLKRNKLAKNIQSVKRDGKLLFIDHDDTDRVR